ncbi:LEA type 2 family protein [Flavihumibacter fluvii]|uniref:LEA type 2 family protein n=1 Tax=Flavihumibacter fluvii TaxID=2838157 RepID=UPI001BDF1EB7|nr:LEA type 2 family protein [Flavihumibacter fluvii]ULQ54400.1 LEA type 2 family protein [Flavihumibacter fluvii]
MLPTNPTRLKWLKITILSAQLFGLASCKQPQIPEYQAFENFTISKFGFSESVVSADLKYYNPNTYALSLKRAELDISINDQPVGKSILDTLIAIPRQDTFYLPVKMKVNMKQLFNNALSLLMNNEIDVKVNGTVKLGKSGVFFNMPVNYAGKQKIEW